jgi:MFS-type transporter involved in bile tolerance (Atg22 family)
MMKAEVTDAFRLRGTVMVILVGLMIVAIIGAFMAVRFAYGMWWYWKDVGSKTTAGAASWGNWYGPGLGPMDL